jgi:hypothetical protein
MSKKSLMLPASLALVGVLAAAVLLDGLACWALLQPQGDRIAAALWLVATPLLLGVSLLLTWRAGREHGWRQRGLLLALPVLLLALLGSGSLRHGTAMWQIASASAPGAELKLLDEGRTVQLRGGIAVGDAQRLQTLMAQHPGVVRLDLSSPGGAWTEAQRLAEQVAARSLTTRSTSACDGACALVFLAGKGRELPAGVELGFQHPRIPSLQPWWQQWALARQGEAYGDRLTPAFVQRLLLFARGSQPWRPQRVDLLQAGALGKPVHRLDVLLPPREGASVAEYQAALQLHPVWAQLERRTPGLIELASTRLLAARETGDDESAWRAAQQLALAQQHLLLSTASGETRQLYLSWLGEALAALGEADADCAALLNADAALRRRLPAELAEREVVWLQEASLEVAAPFRPLKPLEREVIRRTLGQRSSQLLPRLWTASRPGLAPLRCNEARGLVDELGALSGPQRRLVLRAVFDAR